MREEQNVILDFDYYEERLRIGVMNKKVDQFYEQLQQMPNEQQAIAQQLIQAESARKRVQLLATVLDRFGVEAFVGTFVPALGDGATSAMAGAYILAEAERAGMDEEEILKLVVYQGKDFAVGAIPVIGDLADLLLSHANIKSAKVFKTRVKDLEVQAIEDGLDPKMVQLIVRAASKLEKKGDIISREELDALEKEVIAST